MQKRPTLLEVGLHATPSNKYDFTIKIVDIERRYYRIKAQDIEFLSVTDFNTGDLSE